MMIKKAYNYIFYKFYRMFEAGPTVWWSEYKAVALICVLWMLLINTINIYYVILIDRYAELLTTKSIIIALSSVIFFFNYHLFLYRDKWKQIVKEFDNIPKEINKKNGFVVYIFSLIIVVNFIIAIYLMSQIDWN